MSFNVSRHRISTIIATGSGKTKFSEMLVEAGWGVHVSQDDSGGSRYAVERQFVDLLRRDNNVINDNLS